MMCGNLVLTDGNRELIIPLHRLFLFCRCGMTLCVCIVKTSRMENVYVFTLYTWWSLLWAEPSVFGRISVAHPKTRPGLARLSKKRRRVYSICERMYYSPWARARAHVGCTHRKGNIANKSWCRHSYSAASYSWVSEIYKWTLPVT